MSAALACRGDIGTLLEFAGANAVPFTHEDPIGARNYTLGSMVQNLPLEWMTVNETRVWLPSERKLKPVDPESLFTLGDSSMSGLVRMAIDRYVNLVDSISDPRVNDWPLMDSPMPTLAMIVAYLYIVVILGPRLMANRKPFQLKGVLIGYNAVQVIFSLVMLWEHLMSGWLLDYSYKCQPVDYSHNPTALRMANLCWWYYISKLTEFMDTLFFVLRKKDNQVTILHLYHHTLTPIETWICVKFLAGGHGTFSNLVNNGVHVLMYFYYMVAAMGPQYQKYIWWKKYLTTVQLLQFTLVFIHSAQVLIFDCGYPKLVAALLLLHSVIFFALFFDFYQQAYKKSRKLQEKVH